MTQSLLVEFPEEMAVDAIRSGVARRALRRRSAMEIALLVLGTGGSFVSVMQAPDTLRAFSAWLTSRSTSQEETTLVRLARTPDGHVILEVTPGSDPDSVAKLLKQALEGS